MIGWVLLAAASAATPAELRDAITEFNAGAVFSLPVLSEAQLSELSSGRVVSMLTRGASVETWRAIGLIVSPSSQRAVWLSCQDLHFSNAERVIEHRVAGSAASDKASWYGHLDLPMPVSDRHWVVDVWNNHSLSQKTGGRMWEHPWRLNPDGISLMRPVVERGEVAGLALAAFDHAIYTPVNNGAWVAITLPDGETLVAYHGATDIGGTVPGKMVAQFSVSGMQSMLERVSSRAAEVPAHYRSGHAPVLGGDGQRIPTYP